MNIKYDVIIIGSGIGGLVCGCYLAKNGLKVLIVEQQLRAGGYCSSFYKGGYNFDVGVHYLGSLRNGVLRRIFDELDLELEIEKTDSPDKIIFPDKIVYVRNSVNETILEFKKCFQEEKSNIDSFFDYVFNQNYLTWCRDFQNKSFKFVLDSFFKGYKIKSTLNVLLGNIGLSADIAAAVPAIFFFREYVFDSGYYPKGGMQYFPNKLVKLFRKFGGEIKFSSRVKEIVLKDGRNIIFLNDGNMFETKKIVSNADAFSTFKHLIKIKTKELEFLNQLEPSPSMFLVYLGLSLTNKELLELIKTKSNIWCFSSYDIDKEYAYARNNVITKKIGSFLCSFPSLHDSGQVNEKATAILYIHAPYKTERFWNLNKIIMQEKLISSASNVFLNLQNYISLKFSATPHTFYKYTSNSKGSLAGWLQTVNQVEKCFLPQKTSLRDLYLVGHWSTMGNFGQGGIPNVAFSGRRGAALILSEFGKRI